MGWKAQNKSLQIFAGEAYNVEMGITSEMFADERESNGNCIFSRAPNSITNTDPTLSPTVEAFSDVERFAFFMRFLAPPTPSTTTPGGSASITRGRDLFNTTGCAFCHTPTLTTHTMAVPELSKQPANLFSDLALHHMGATLADGISQGLAGGDEFRTAPLWGVGQRLFFLHDGRTSDLGAAIEAHASPTNQCTTVQDYEQFNANGTWFQPFTSVQVCGEANSVVNNYNALSASQQTDLLAFLRTL